MYLSIEPFGHMGGGRESVLYTLENANGCRLSISDYGARITDIQTPDASGRLDHVTLGFDSVEPYHKYRDRYFGATCGRVANRIRGGFFQLDGKGCALSKNEGENTLHGGERGFDAVLWAAAFTADGLQLSYESPDGDMGFPGALSASVTFSLSDENALSIVYEAVSDLDTLFNPSNHSYFNLDGRESPSVLSHRLLIDANAYCPMDEQFLPTGELRSVAGTPFDFTAFKPVGADINAADAQLRLAGGYDHCFALNGESGTLRRCAELVSDCSGRRLSVYTTLPGLQLYTANALPEKTGFPPRSALCLETQYFPDAIHQPSFLQPILRAGVRARHETQYRFGTV